ncbi:MAG: IS1182 family transposase [Pseudomonadales bacterium]
MANFKVSNAHQGTFVSVIPDKQIVRGSFDHAVNYLVDNTLDLSAFEQRYRNDKGGAPAYPPSVLLKIVLAAYSRGITSSRDIEDLCRENTVFMALSGFLTPDHSTIAAFVSGMPGDIEPLFARIILACDELDLIGRSHFAIDGVKLPSNASREWSGRTADFEKKYDKLRHAIRFMLQRHHEEDAAAQVNQDVRAQELKQIAKLGAVSKKIHHQLKTMEDKTGANGKVVKSNITDNDSAHMRTGNQGALQGYVGVAIADDQHQVICSAMATGDSEHSSFEPMIDQLEAHVDSLAESELSADAGFHSHAAVDLCHQRGIDAYIADTGFRQRDPRFKDQAEKKPSHRQKKYFKADEFRYDDASNRCWCPAGKEMWLASDRYFKNGRWYAAFEGYLNDCKRCAVQSRCMRRPATVRGRQVSVLKGREDNPPRPIDLMREKIDSRQGRLRYAKRIGTIEPVFAHIRSTLGLDRFSLRGRPKVNAQWLLFCMVHNITKIAYYGDYES